MIKGNVMTEELNQIEELTQALAARERKLAQAMAALANRQVEIEKLKAAMLSAGNGSMEALQADLKPVTVSAGLDDYARAKGRELAQAMQTVRDRRLVRILERTVYRQQSQWELISPAFQQLKDDTLLYAEQLQGYALRASVNLQTVPLLRYKMTLRRAGLKGVLLAFWFDFPPESGELGIELVSAAGEILAQASVPAAMVDDRRPVQFNFTPLAESGTGELGLCVFARNVDLPVRVLELQHYPLFGLRHVVTQPFAGYLFE